MGDNNKVMSVSYGTFSCRLEGFDDSVETLKAVVGYFHALAGHDRFMDMDPQAPDLEELAEIAVEGESAPVEAIMDDAGISLRVAHEDVADEDDTEEEDQAEEELNYSVRLVGPRPFADDAADEDTEDAHVMDAVAEDDAEETDEEPILPVDEDEAEEVATFDDDSADEAEALEDADLEDEVEDDIAAMADSDDETDEDEAFVADEEPDAAEDDNVVSFETEEAVAEEAEDDTQFYAPPQAEDAPPADDSVAAKLERIRAVVGRVPPPNQAPTSREAVDQDRPTSNIVDRLSALTGTDPNAKAEEPEDEELVDDFDFEAEESAPLVLAESAAEDTDEVDDDATEDEATDEAMAEDDPAEAEDAELHMRRENYSKREYLPENDDDAMSRILSKTDAQLNEPEGRRHRDAFAQLKAAVAATEAARQLGDQPTDDDPEDAFRDDLTEVTKPDDHDDRPISRPISRPLKLVAEQLIDKPSNDPAERLRQIASVKETGDAKGGFAEFAAEQGATELGDLLEAAAAYISFVEGDEDFSRPQVMKKVQMAASDDFSREDGLRSFGRLLRQSRIIKLNNGRFQVSQDTRFRPDEGEVAQG